MRKFILLSQFDYTGLLTGAISKRSAQHILAPGSVLDNGLSKANDPHHEIIAERLFRSRIISYVR